MTCDRAGYLNNYGFGNCGGFQDNCNDSKLIHKELHYVETYVKNREAGCGGRFNNYGNCGSGGYGNCGFGGYGNCGFGGYDNCGFDGCFDNYCAPCAPCIPTCAPCIPSWGFPKYKTKKVKKTKKDDDKKDDDGPCNPFCTPCYKPKCNDPCDKFKDCDCKSCKRSYKKIYEH